jgi:hypothetical protein
MNDDDKRSRLLLIPWLLAMALVLFSVIVGGVIVIFNSHYFVNDYFRNVAIVTAALLLAIGGFNGRMR